MKKQQWLSPLHQILNPMGSTIPVVRYSLYTGSSAAESLARFDPPGSGPGTPTPGFSLWLTGSGQGGALHYFRRRLDRAGCCSALCK